MKRALPPMRKNSPRAWWLAARPKTLSAALIPVATATAMAFADGGFRAAPALLCFLFAALMQVAANFINDLYDFKRGTDRDDRLGPERACAQGWISEKAMGGGILLTLLLAGAAGLSLLPYGGSALIYIGVSCVVFAFLYTTLLSYVGGGDLLVWAFFGFVPVAGTYYVQTGALSARVWLLGAACGLVADTLLVLNNYRDRVQDAVSGKRTLVVAFGRRFGSLLYLLQGFAGAFCCSAALGGKGWPCALPPLLYLLPHTLTWRRMARTEGKALNRLLGETSRNMLIFALLTMAALAFLPASS